jgi:hypothetical protein
MAGNRHGDKEKVKLSSPYHAAGSRDIHAGGATDGPASPVPQPAAFPAKENQLGTKRTSPEHIKNLIFSQGHQGQNGVRTGQARRDIRFRQFRLTRQAHEYLCSIHALFFPDGRKTCNMGPAL